MRLARRKPGTRCGSEAAEDLGPLSVARGRTGGTSYMLTVGVVWARVNHANGGCVEGAQRNARDARRPSEGVG